MTMLPLSSWISDKTWSSWIDDNVNLQFTILAAWNQQFWMKHLFIAWDSQFCLSTYTRSTDNLGKVKQFFLFAWSCFRETTWAHNMRDVNHTSSLKNRRTMIEAASPDYKSWSICRMAAQSQGEQVDNPICRYKNCFQDARHQGRQYDLEHSYRLYKGLVIHGPHESWMGQCDREKQEVLVHCDDHGRVQFTSRFQQWLKWPFARNRGRPMSEEFTMKSTMNSAGKDNLYSHCTAIWHWSDALTRQRWKLEQCMILLVQIFTIDTLSAWTKLCLWSFSSQWPWPCMNFLYSLP